MTIRNLKLEDFDDVNNLFMQLHNWKWNNVLICLGK